MSETAADRFLSDHGVNDVAQAVRAALDIFLTAQADYRQGEYDRASSGLAAFWKTYPAGSDVWGDPARTMYEQLRTNGVFLGDPPCYYALRMLTEAVQWRVRSRPLDDHARRPASVPVTLTVVLVGRAEGTQPRSQAELEANRGAPVSLALEPALLADEYQMIRQSLGLFGEYVSAITDGRLALRAECIPLLQTTVAVSVKAGDPRYAGPADGALARVWESVPAAVKSQTDWWWVICPSVVPEQYADFATEEFVTGGMYRGPDSDSPCFLSDDRSLIRKPPHLGHGPYTDLERDAYMPQWLQHEFFHHLFGLYPEFGLEKKSHQWSEREAWPEDFQGSLEPDYYAEALHKVLIPHGDPALHVKLRYAAPDAEVVRRLNLESLEGLYRREPMENDWHEGSITREGSTEENGARTYRWTNRAGASWPLTYVSGELSLPTGPGNPYADQLGADYDRFALVLKRDGDGAYLPEVAGFKFDFDFYRRTGP